MLERRQKQIVDHPDVLFFLLHDRIPKLSVALWSSSPFTAEVLPANTIALYHVTSIKYLNNYYESLSLKHSHYSAVSSLIRPTAVTSLRHGLTSDARSTQVSSQNIHVTS